MGFVKGHIVYLIGGNFLSCPFLSPRGEMPSELRIKEVRGQLSNLVKDTSGGFPGGAVVKNLPANAGDTGSSPGPGRSHMP